jgi:hypothetical protein
MLRKIASIALGSLLLLGLGWPLARPALAAPAAGPFIVDSPLDGVDDLPGDGLCHAASGHCTLRAAVMEANLTSGLGVTIIVPVGIYTLTIPIAGADDASSGDLNLATPASGSPFINLTGAGAAATIIDGNQLDRVLSVAADRTATVSGLTLRGGFVSGGSGGGLANAGTLTVTHSTLAANSASVAGGGAVNLAALTLIQSTVSGNSASTGGGAFNAGSLTLIQSTITANGATAGDGGGLYNNGSGPLLVDRSTIADNHAQNGGGIDNAASRSLILVNSTLSENYAIGSGGAIYNDGQANLYSTTIVDNWADSDRQGAGSGGGVYNTDAGPFNLRNSLLAGNNVGNAPVWDECTNTVNVYGVDIVGLQGQPNACTLPAPDFGVFLKLNSLGLLGGLQDNGGPTPTIALLRGSNAISDNAISFACTDQNAALLATDQRGVVRVLGGNCDIGAFEFMPPVLFLPLLRR